MKRIINIIILTCTCIYIAEGQSLSVWPLSMNGQDQQVKLYKPAIENIEGNRLGFRAALSATDQGSKTPLFGSVWGTFTVSTNESNKTAKVIKTEIDDIRFPEGITTDEKNTLTELIVHGFAKTPPVLSISDISKDIDDANKETTLASQMKNTPPKIIYANEASILVFIDGEPVVQNTERQDVGKVMNSPFLILKYQNAFYLSNGNVWYKSSSATGKFLPEKNAPSAVRTVAESMKTDDDSTIADSEGDFYPKVIVSTEPAELIQTDGAPDFSAIQETSLLYVSNSEDQLLFDIGSQKYYVLLSGRWYTTSRLDGDWVYIQTDGLPADFAKIPEGTEKDVVLASVPGTMAAREAVRDAQVPKVAMVERNKAKSEVIYDGDPEFQGIEGTNMQASVNSSNPVIYESNRYYLVDDGVWFVSSSPRGPWKVSDYRPSQVNNIPPSSPVYNVKYVYIYESTPEVVYVGYTPGYTCSYVYNHTIVYGTGWYYRPWHRSYYFPRPYTWGFGMSYNPWYGWSLNMCYGVGGYGWFGYRYHHHNYHHYGWWGPPVFRPPYRPPYTHCYGYRPAVYRPPHYGAHIVARPSVQSRPNNIYRNRASSGVQVTRNRQVASVRSSSSRESYNYSKAATPVRTATSTRSSTSSARQSITRQGTSSSTRSSVQPAYTTRQSTAQPSVRPSSNQSFSRSSSVQPSTRSSTGTYSQPARSSPGSSSQSSSRSSTSMPSRPSTSMPTKSSTRQSATMPAQPSNRASTGSYSQPSRSTTSSSGTTSSRSSTSSGQSSQRSNSQVSSRPTSGNSVQPSSSRSTTNSVSRPSTSSSSNSSNRSGTSSSSSSRQSSSGRQSPGSSSQPARR